MMLLVAKVDVDQKQSLLIDRSCCSKSFLLFLFFCFFISLQLNFFKGKIWECSRVKNWQLIRHTCACTRVDGTRWMSCSGTYLVSNLDACGWRITACFWHIAYILVQMFGDRPFISIWLVLSLQTDNFWEPKCGVSDSFLSFPGQL